MTKALLFLNGETPDLSQFTHEFLDSFSCIVATDGAYNYLKNNSISVDCVIGDFDSLQDKNTETEFIYISEQDTTDFEKALHFLVSKNIKNVSVFGASGKEQDHFLGNLSAALKFQSKIKIDFYDAHHQYFFIEDYNIELNNVFGKKISLYPFPEAVGITTIGLEFPLKNETLNLQNRIGIRNKAIEKTASISYKSGNLLLFIER